LAGERYQTREAVDARRGTSQAEELASASASPSLNRRHLLFGAAAAVIAGAAVATLLSRSSTLPMPSGQAVGPEYLAATLKLKAAPVRTMPPDHSTWAGCAGAGPTKGLADLDLVLAIDTTGSMGGVINDVKANIRQLISSLRTGAGTVRVGIVAYRDTVDEYIVRPLPLTVLDDAGTAAIDGFIAGLQAAGGGDWPEKLDAALDVATGMFWRGDVPASIVIIADAPAHAADEATALATAEAFSSKIPGAQVSLIDTGSGGHAFMQALPKRGGGQYVTYDGHLLKSLFPAITGCPNS
jgi:hypothetical protein